VRAGQCGGQGTSGMQGRRKGVCYSFSVPTIEIYERLRKGQAFLQDKFLSGMAVVQGEDDSS